MQKGGITPTWTTGVYCPLDDFLPQNADFIGWVETLGTIGNNFLAVPPRSIVLNRALKDAVSAINRGDSDILWLSTGPAVVTRAFASVIAESVMSWPAWLDRTFLLSHAALLRGISIHSPLPYKKTKNYWLHTAFGKHKSTLKPE